LLVLLLIMLFSVVESPTAGDLILQGSSVDFNDSRLVLGYWSMFECEQFGVIASLFMCLYVLFSFSKDLNGARGGRGSIERPGPDSIVLIRAR
jgi:hypothetical protein